LIRPLVQINLASMIDVKKDNENLYRRQRIWNIINPADLEKR